MLLQEQINNNKTEFIELVRRIKRPDAKIEELINTLETSDFFVAPASVKNHNSFEGGLCDHCLNVYYNMRHLVNYKFSEIEINDEIEESIIILALLHDISKMNLYTKTVRNVKVYSPQGDKSDSMGKFYWDTQSAYAINERGKRFIYGSHEMRSEYIARQFIPLTLEESAAILHHMGGANWDSAKDNIEEVYVEYPLALLLHLSDMLATFSDERSV